jgi:chemosensory pili system protein ChpC
MAPMQPAESIPESPDWLIGLYHWRNQAVPLLSYEVLNGRAYFPLNPQGRVAVLNNTGVDARLPFIAIPTQGIPRMAKVGKDDITENTDIPKRPFDLMAVRVGMEELFIPDIAALENAFLKLGLLK